MDPHHACDLSIAVAVFALDLLLVSHSQRQKTLYNKDDCSNGFGMHADLRLYTRKVEVAKDRLPSWPHDKLTVLAEQPSIFYDLMNETMMEQVSAVSNITNTLHAILLCVQDVA